jgi:hypothetical protein
VRPCDQPPDSGELGVAHLEVGDHKPKRTRRRARGRRRRRDERDAEDGDIDRRQHRGCTGEPRSSQQESPERGAGEHDEVLQPEDVRKLKDPGDPVKEAENGREADDQDHADNDPA